MLRSIPFCLFGALLAQDPVLELPRWLAPGKGAIELHIRQAGTTPAPWVLVGGGGDDAKALAEALAERGITTAILREPTAALLGAAEGLLRLHAAELGIRGERGGLAATAAGAQAMLDLTMEERVPAVALVLLDAFAPVIEGLRKDLPIGCFASTKSAPRVHAGMRELTHQASLAGAAVQFAVVDQAHAAAGRFLAARLQPAPIDRAKVTVEDALEFARAAADGKRVADATSWLDHALTLAPERAVTLASDHALAGLRADRAFAQWLAARAPVGSVRITPDCEMGQPMQVRCTITDGDDRPLGGVLVDLWQTDALGFYNHQQRDDDARLRGRVRTAADGTFVVHGIRPGGYPATMIPSHVHVRVHASDQPTEVELLFADDPRLTDALAERLTARGFAVTTLDAHGRGTARFRLQPR